MRYDQKAEAVFYDCGFCGREFQFGKNRYEGHSLGYYELMVCKGCVSDKGADIPPVFEKICLTKLTELNKEVPQRNAKGTLPAFAK